MDRYSPESLINFLDNATSSVRAVLSCSLKSTGEDEQQEVPQKNLQGSSSSRIRKKVKAQPRRRLKRFNSQHQGPLYDLWKDCSAHPQTVNDILRLSEQSQGDYQSGYTSQWVDRYHGGSNSNQDFDDGQWQGHYNGNHDDGMNTTCMYQNVQNFSPDSHRSVDEYFCPDVANMMPIGCHLPPPLHSTFSYPPVRMSQERNMQKMLSNMKEARLANTRQNNPKAQTQAGQNSSDGGNVRDLLSELVSELEKTDAFDVLTGKMSSFDQQNTGRITDKKHGERVPEVQHNMSREENNQLNLNGLTFANKSDSQELVNAFQDTKIGTIDGDGTADTNGLTSYFSTPNITINDEVTATLDKRNAHSNGRDKIRQLKQLHEQKSMPNLHLYRHQQSLDSDSHQLQPWRTGDLDTSCLISGQTPKVVESLIPNCPLNSHDVSFERNNTNCMSFDGHRHGNSKFYAALTEDVRRTSVSVDDINLIPTNSPHVASDWVSSSGLDHVGIKYNGHATEVKQSPCLDNQSNMNFVESVAMTSENYFEDMSNSDMSLYSPEEQQQHSYHLQHQQQQTHAWNNQVKMTDDTLSSNANQSGSTMRCGTTNQDWSASRLAGAPQAFLPSRLESISPRLTSDLNQYDRVDVCMSPPVTDTESFWSEEEEEEEEYLDELDGGDAHTKGFTNVDWKTDALQNNYYLPVANPVQQLPSFATTFLH